MLDTQARLKRAIRDVPDFPKPGILFKDITPLLADPECLRLALDEFEARWRPENVEAVAATLSTLELPRIFTPFAVVTTSPALAPSTLPPRSTARSTITEPARIGSIIAEVIRIGAVRPGISAVVMTMSWRRRCSLTSSACLAW